MVPDQVSARKTLIHVPRELIRACAAKLSDTPHWRRRPFTSLKSLIYGLNTLFEHQKFLAYNFGFPRPSVALRELKGVASLAARGHTVGLSWRLETLRDRKRDSYNLLLFQFALERDPDHPEQAVQAPETLVLLDEVARTEPTRIAAFADKARALLTPLVTAGRGGTRNRGKLSEEDIAFRLGGIFIDCTGKAPGTTYNHEDGHTGRFIEFSRLVFAAMGYRLKGRQIYDRYTSRNVSGWQFDKRRWPSSSED